jgi:O-antigen/teichoic acid export membrane protein
LNSLFRHKSFIRLFIIASHAMSQFLPSVGNLLVSVVVIRMLVPEWWGEIAVLQLYMYISVQVCAWGNKDELIRDFSIQSSALKRIWSESFNKRSFLLLFAFVGVLFITNQPVVQLNLCIWILLRYIQQAFEAPVVFRRRFNISIISDLMAIGITLSLLLFFRKDIQLSGVLFIMSAGQLIKVLILIVSFRSYFVTSSVKPDMEALKNGLPFMILGLSGVMLQKTDMINVAWFLNKYEIAQYQVFSSFLLFMQAFPGLITGPYAKNIYRISSSTYYKIQVRFILLGMLITAVSILITYFTMTMIYAFEFSCLLYLLGFVYGGMTYFYSMRIYILYKMNEQNKVMWISMAGILFNLVACYILVPRFHITGALLGNTLTQLLLVIAYHFTKINVSVSSQQMEGIHK